MVAPFDGLRVLAILINETVILSLSKDDCNHDLKPHSAQIRRLKPAAWVDVLTIGLDFADS